MRIGVVYPQNETHGDPSGVRDIGLAAEDLGYDSILFYDHVVGAEHADREPPLWGPYTEDDSFHDPFVAFGYLAAITSRIELATGVMILPQRQTVLAAQQAADVDLLSHERVRLGVGTGWNWVEYDALGTEFATRGARLDEQIVLLRELWANRLVTFDGRFHQLDRCCINPRPSRAIPIWIGGFSEAAFRRGARLGDGFTFAGSVDDAVGGLARLHELLDEAGRSAGRLRHRADPHPRAVGRGGAGDDGDLAARRRAGRLGADAEGRPRQHRRPRGLPGAGQDRLRRRLRLARGTPTPATPSPPTLRLAPAKRPRSGANLKVGGVGWATRRRWWPCFR